VTSIQLIYSIASSRLFGDVTGMLTGNTTRIDMRAVSGGRAGSTTVKPDPFLANNPNAAWIKSLGKSGAAGHTEGGPIPPGKYRLLRPGSRGTHPTWIPIEPSMHFALGRTDLYIHPEGQHGSDGCIVLTLNDFNILRGLLEKAPIIGNSVAGLDVVATAPPLTTRL
jgi:hypothetical protein